MFSGIIQSQQKALSFLKKNQSICLTLPIPKTWKIKKGDSIAIDGICATVEDAKSSSISVFFMPETVKKTHILSLDSNHKFNLEQPLQLRSFVGGHLVSGHIDTQGKVLSITNDASSKMVTVKLNPRFSKYIIYKGSIAVNGVSLTVVSFDKDSFSFSLIPYTLSHTSLRLLKQKDIVNIEVDLIGKYLEKILKRHLSVD